MVGESFLLAGLDSSFAFSELQRCRNVAKYTMALPKACLSFCCFVRTNASMLNCSLLARFRTLNPDMTPMHSTLTFGRQTLVARNVIPTVPLSGVSIEMSNVEVHNIPGLCNVTRDSEPRLS